jgi:hypothetical protein
MSLTTSLNHLVFGLKSKIISLFLAVGLVLTVETCAPEDPVQYVDPRIGNVGLILEPTRPTIQLPNKMIIVYPNRKDYLDDQIY